MIPNTKQTHLTLKHDQSSNYWLTASDPNQKSKTTLKYLRKERKKEEETKKKSLEFIAALVGSIKDLIKFLPIERHVIINEEE